LCGGGFDDRKKYKSGPRIGTRSNADFKHLRTTPPFPLRHSRNIQIKLTNSAKISIIHVSVRHLSYAPKSCAFIALLAGDAIVPGVKVQSHRSLGQSRIEITAP
jgi:hypothetical protein